MPIGIGNTYTVWSGVSNMLTCGAKKKSKMHEYTVCKVAWITCIHKVMSITWRCVSHHVQIVGFYSLCYNSLRIQDFQGMGLRVVNVEVSDRFFITLSSTYLLACDLLNRRHSPSPTRHGSSSPVQLRLKAWTEQNERSPLREPRYHRKASPGGRHGSPSAQGRVKGYSLDRENRPPNRQQRQVRPSGKAVLDARCYMCTA